ncbi:hypothetical protein WL35_17910 [Burkholderia ubonensis]|nr:hypothetical protein WL35_17910 [Burkholderia ubonensis]KWO79088.1 hypothetical protein WM32_30320 [Burkholderia ubonensis]
MLDSTTDRADSGDLPLHIHVIFNAVSITFCQIEPEVAQLLKIVPEELVWPNTETLMKRLLDTSYFR